MTQPVRVQMLSIATVLEDLVGMLRSDLRGNLLNINKRLLEIEIYLDQLKTQKLSRKIRDTLNKFEKEFKELKIYLFLTPDISLFKEKALTWANILTHRAKLA